MLNPIRLITVLMFSAFLALPCFAEEKTLPQKDMMAPLSMAVQAQDEVHVKGYKGQVDYVAVAGARELTVTVQGETATKGLANSGDWDFHFRRDGKKIVIQVENSGLSKADWALAIQADTLPTYNMKIVGPSLPFYLNWRNGPVRITGLQSDAYITSIKSEVIVDGGDGITRINTQEGEVRIANRKGALKVDTYQAKVTLKDIEGGIELDNFTGESVVQSVNGNMQLASFNGTTKINGLKGRVDFKNGNAGLYIENMEGELRGNTEQGPVFAEVRGTADVHLVSKEGAVNLKLPSSGAWVNLGTEGGNMAVPSFLKTTRMASQQVRTGKLKGSSGGSVFVRTQSGDIRIR